MAGSFEINLKTLEEQNPLLALQLRQVKPCNVEEKSSTASPDEKTEVLYVYGVSSCYQDLKGWLRENEQHKLIFIEDEMERFGFFLGQPETERLLLDPQVKVVVLAGSPEEALKDAIWDHLFRPYECRIMTGKNASFASHFSDLKMQAEHLMCLYRDYGAPQMKNVLVNLGRAAICGDSLEGKLKGTPAIICGAGPSLEKNVDLLKTLGSRAAIFAGGSALLPLKKRDVPVHFGGSIDPDPPLDRYEPFEMPFFFQNQTSASLLAKGKGTFVRMGPSGGFPLERWLDEKLPPFDAGTHVGTFLTHVAEFLGCSPIIFVGMDGCRLGDTLYIDEIDETRRDDPLIVLDRFGNRVQSRADFLLGRRWFENFAKTHPETLLLNATEGGLSMEGIENVTLQEVKDQRLSKEVDVSGLFQGATLEKPNSKLEEFAKSLCKCQELCQEFSPACEQALSEEVFYQLVLMPNWEVWRYFFQKEEIVRQMDDPVIEKIIQQILFFRDICEQYERILPR